VNQQQTGFSLSHNKWVVWDNLSQRMYCVINPASTLMGKGIWRTRVVVGTLKTRDWKTRELKNVETVTKHKCSNNAERELKATAQKHRYQKLRI